MNGLFAAAAEVQALCDQRGWPFCFIGGLAVQRWGEARITRDVDLTLLTGYGGEEPVVTALLARFDSRVEDPLGLALRARVVLLRTAAGVPVDVALGALPFEERSVARSSLWAVPGTAPLRTCGAEDLVVHKAFAGRDRDWADLRGIAASRGPDLDRRLIAVELAPLLAAKDAAADLGRVLALLDAAAS